MAKGNTLKAVVSAAAAKEKKINLVPPSKKAAPELVLVQAQFRPEVRSALFRVRAKTGKNMRGVLGEAINDLCVKYHEVPPFNEEE